VSAAPAAGQVFLFGKAPAHGDFVCRGLTEAERATWDRWCSAELVEARARLGEHFGTAHLTTPPWRFVLAPATPDMAWMAGCVTPSCDRVGRPFLLVLGVRRAGALDPAEGARLAERLQAPLREAFRDDAGVDQAFAAAEAALAGPELADARPPPVEMTEWRIGHIGLPPTVDAFGDLA
jgi:type VI secretion system ImpM family protein